MVKHIVTFKLSGTAEERAAVALRFAEALKALPGQIECLESIEVGINENPAEDWDVVLTATLPSPADVAVYAAHPAHVAAASIIAGCKAARACVDYTVG
ncbi:Dabb family protein [Paramuribaculum intestinale]|uniref:Dabb family protein n=1 Tax=Paramuribaculum intestinale TaxID=2094151 RepID=UPI00272B9822|nr:Dabb family protein [Paramuribaculum intestinale]